MKLRKYAAVSLAAAMLVSSAAVVASAANDNEPDKEQYLLMNIPYSEFYKADLNNDVQVDVYTSATKSKTKAGNLVSGSYHTDSSGDEINGITFPVKVKGNIDLSKYKQVKDSDSFDITVSLRGKETTTTYSGREALFENPSYSYYVLDEVPSFYKEVSQNGDGSLVFGETVGSAEEIEAEAEITKNSRYGDYQINITNEELQNAGKVYAVILSTEEGNDYGLRHMENIWRNTALAWCTGYTQNVHGSPTSSAHYEAMVGQTINKVTYYTDGGIKTISGLSLYVDPDKYALMNIPYSDFYASEVENEVPVDIYSSATKAKTMTGTLVSGSYHVSPEGTDITGITYPVKLGDIDLSKYRKITDNDTYEATVTNRGQTSTTVYEGKDALFCADNYSYYILDEVPAYYKTVSENDDGSLSFSKDSTQAEEITAEAELSTDSKYGDYQINVTSEELQNSEKVYAVVLSTEEGSSYGLRHLENIWRNTALAWCTGFTDTVHGCPTSSAHYEAIMGQTINKITYFTSEGKKSFETNLYVPVKTGAKLSANNAAVSDGSTDFTAESFADDYGYEYAVTDEYDQAVDAVVENGTIKYPTTIGNGKYTLTVSDKNGKYAPVSASFELTVAAPAQFNGNVFSEEPAIVAADDASEEEFAAYLEAVAQVTVGEKTYNVSGKGAVAVIDPETGAIDTSNTDVFAEDEESFEITVKATGYDPITFTLPRTETPDDPKDDPSEESSGEPTDEESKNTDTDKKDDTDSKGKENSASSNSTSGATNAAASSNTAATSTSTIVDVPQTSDAASVIAILALIAASVCAAVVLRKKKSV